METKQEQTSPNLIDMAHWAIANDDFAYLNAIINPIMMIYSSPDPDNDVVYCVEFYDDTSTTFNPDDIYYYWNKAKKIYYESGKNFGKMELRYDLKKLLNIK
jgi:hypothetical protein